MRAIVDAARRGFLSSVDGRGRPHTVPVCFAVTSGALATPVDHKPKSGRRLARLRNIEMNPQVSLTVDRWDEDWGRLGWVLFRGHASIEPPGTAAAELAARYPQYRDRPPGGEVILIRPEQVVYWTAS